MDVFDVGEFLHVGIGALQRAVHRIVGELEKEGLVVVAIDEIDRFAREGIGEVWCFGDGLATADNRVVGIVVGFVAPPCGRYRSALSGRPTGLRVRPGEFCGAAWW